MSCVAWNIDAPVLRGRSALRTDLDGVARAQDLCIDVDRVRQLVLEARECGIALQGRSGEVVVVAILYQSRGRDGKERILRIDATLVIVDRVVRRVERAVGIESDARVGRDGS